MLGIFSKVARARGHKFPPEKQYHLVALEQGYLGVNLSSIICCPRELRQVILYLLFLTCKMGIITQPTSWSYYKSIIKLKPYKVPGI